MIVSDLLKPLLELCESENLSDLHVSANTALMGRFDGRLKAIQEDSTWTEERSVTPWNPALSRAN